MKFKQTDCTFLFENIFAEISCILKDINYIHNRGQFIVRHFQSHLVYFQVQEQHVFTEVLNNNI